MAASQGIGDQTPANFETPYVGRTPLTTGDPMHDLYPAMDARFVLVEVGKLTTKVDRLIEDVGKLGGKVDTLRGQVSFVRGAAWVLGALILLVGPLLAAILSGKLSIGFH